MIPQGQSAHPAALLRRRLGEARINPQAIEERRYPDELILIVRVLASELASATAVAQAADRELAEAGVKGFTIVKVQEPLDGHRKDSGRAGVGDSRSGDLVNLLTARARTSEVQPSLSFIPDAARNIAAVVSPRHQLVFGRRGAGKTALLVEGKRTADSVGAMCIWVNLQTHRHAGASRVALWICDRLCEAIQTQADGKDESLRIGAKAAEIRGHIADVISLQTISTERATMLLPDVNSLVKRFLAISKKRAYVFLDDLHYLPRAAQPELLDMVHGAVRDADAWIKVAAIKHLSRWFQPHPPLGLQTGHDADHIDLDLTLENPIQAKNFLEAVLAAYAAHVGFSSIAKVFSSASLDRLVLAAGAVPRDFLVLSAGAIRQAQRRDKARQVGVQDVNKAAGDAAKVKIAEMEDDAASLDRVTRRVTAGLQRIRRFCLEEKKFTYFRVDFRDKENLSNEYEVIQELMDLRLLHLVDAGLSDEREAGVRSEVYMLDLSQFSGQRLKKKLRVLDFENGHIVLKETGTQAQPRLGNTPKQRLGILRRGPLFSLSLLGSPDESKLLRET